MSTAIVLGGGIAGMLSALALARSFDEVTILERESERALGERSGVPQGAHVHALLNGGLESLNRQLPGFGDRLVQLGAIASNATLDWISVFPRGPFVRFSSELIFACCSRALIEQVLREYVDAEPHIRWISGARVISVDLSAQNSPQVHVSGTGDAQKMRATLVVDCTGRNSHAAEWLMKAGYVPPPLRQTHPNLGYASRIYCDVTLDNCNGILIMPSAPRELASAVLLPLENKRFLVTLGGLDGRHPPADEDGFLRYLDTDRLRLIHDAVRTATPVGPAKAFVKESNSYRAWGHTRSWPNGFLVNGDALCSFNPLYAQGMTTAALATEYLALMSSSFQPGCEWSRKVQRGLSKVYYTPWLTSVIEDMRWNAHSTRVPRFAARLSHWWTNKVWHAATTNPVVALEFLWVLHMRKPPQALLSPRVVFEVLRSR